MAHVEENPAISRLVRLRNNRFADHPVASSMETMGQNVAWTEPAQNFSFLGATADMYHERDARLACGCKRLFQGYDSMIRRHPSQAQFHTHGAVPIFLDHRRGFLRPRVAQIQEFFSIGCMKSHERDMDESEDIREAMIQHSSPELREVGITCATGVHRCGDAVIETNARTYAVEISLVPVAMEINQARANIFAGDLANVRAVGRVEVGPIFAIRPSRMPTSVSASSD